MKDKVAEKFGVYSVEVNYCKRVGITKWAQKANELMSKDKSSQQVLIEDIRLVLAILFSYVEHLIISQSINIL